MKPLRGRIAHAAHAGRLPQPVIEKDYALSYLLAGVAGHPALADTLIFKGGTALKKLFFGEYRVSEDLDFSSRGGAPRGNRLEASLREAAAGALNLLTGQGPFSLEFERYLEREPHPQGQEAFIIRLKFPWHPGPMCRIKLEVSHDEPVLLAPERRTLIHGYGEDLAIKVSCYALEEIVAEKLRTLLQTRRKFLERGWNRPRARDYYDLWRILEAYGEQLDPGTINRLLIRKCEHRGVAFSGIDDFFGKELIAESRRHWQANLGQFVDQLPPCETVLMRLRELMQVMRFGRPGSGPEKRLHGRRWRRPSFFRNPPTVRCPPWCRRYASCFTMGACGRSTGHGRPPTQPSRRSPASSIRRRPARPGT